MNSTIITLLKYRQNFPIGEREKSRGFTMIEAVVAILIFSIGFLAVLYLVPVGVKLDQRSRDSSVAINLAQEKTEEVNGITYDDLNTGTIEAKARLSTDPNNFLYNYQRETTVNYVDENLSIIGNDQGMKQVEVKVYWQGIRGEKSVTLATLISKL